ncbi:hypothetical protein JCM9140_1145 [Halalkalibacter wakoensis JCM 9140]|uniref:Uncharacterized protein n=1 Tax=Halalkalibacter wakoensis JCM 9140 TaxID=1236970 RepID=W4PZK3_9BACI|nr:hypothetical protein [Halalkalibacter wakoensis]GAE25167.1 hypothetical protein JCM9140_1145 [Halalkalibacter wakoensis JCM 9140]
MSLNRNLGLEDLLKDLLDKRDKKEDKDRSIKDILKKLPPNYPVDRVFLKDQSVEVDAFSNLCDSVAYFIDDDGEVIVFDVNKITGLAFGEDLAPKY